MMVIGMGERKTPKPFCVACNVFKYLDILTENEEQASEDPYLSDVKETEPESMTNMDTILRAMTNIITENGDEERGISIGELGNHILKRYPDFDSRNYGYSKLSQFIGSLNQFDIDIRPSGNPHVKHTYIRLRAGRKK